MLNVLMLGVGQCGNRIMDAVNKEAFGGGATSKISKYCLKPKFPSRVETLAINTAINDLKELRFTHCQRPAACPQPAWSRGQSKRRQAGLHGQPRHDHGRDREERRFRSGFCDNIDIGRHRIFVLTPAHQRIEETVQEHHGDYGCRSALPGRGVHLPAKCRIQYARADGSRSRRA